MPELLLALGRVENGDVMCSVWCFGAEVFTLLVHRVIFNASIAKLSFIVQ